MYSYSLGSAGTSLKYVFGTCLSTTYSTENLLKLVNLFFIHRLSVFVIVLRGLKEALKKRLKAFYKRRKLSAAHIQPHTAKPRVDFLLVIDFEATCQQNTTDYRHEIIEFPIVVIDTHRCQVVGDNCVCDIIVHVAHCLVILQFVNKIIEYYNFV